MVLERGRMTGTLPGRDGADWRLREAPSSGMTLVRALPGGGVFLNEKVGGKGGGHAPGGAPLGLILPSKSKAVYL